MAGLLQKCNPAIHLVFFKSNVMHWKNSKIHLTEPSEHQPAKLSEF
jgi:hypothetical protein